MGNYRIQLNLANINQVRFILMVLIVLLHSYTTSKTNPISVNWITQEYFSQVVARIAVPVYFYISGYLFFKNLKTIENWKNKIVKRIKTLLIPYLIWNIAYGIFLLIIPSSISINKEGNLSENFLNLFNSILISPAINPLWFIRDLFIIQLISILYVNLKNRYKHILIGLLFIAFLYSYTIPFTLLSSEGLLFFTLGAFGILPAQTLFSNRNIIFISFIAISVLNLFNHLYETELQFYLHRMLTYFLAIIFVCAFLSSTYGFNSKLIGRLTDFSFYIFVLHFPIIQFISKYFKVDGLLGYFILFVSSLTLSIFIGLLISKNQRLSGLLTGNRSE